MEKKRKREEEEEEEGDIVFTSARSTDMLWWDRMIHV